MKHERTCCIVGHQPANLPFGSNESDKRCLRLKAALRAEIEKQLPEDGTAHQF